MASRATEAERNQILATIAYQFGSSVRTRLEKEELEVIRSGATKKIRFVHIGGEEVFAMNPSVAMFSPSLIGAMLIHEASKPPLNRVVAHEDAIPFVRKGKTLFCQHVIGLQRDLPPKAEVIVVDKDDQLHASGVLMISSTAALQLQNGPAVRVRRGMDKMRGSS